MSAQCVRQGALAEGKTDACIILGSHLWDIAAGAIIAAEQERRLWT